MNSIPKSKSFIRDIPLDKITIDRLAVIFSTTVRVSINGEVCLLRLNPHHMGYTYLNIAGVKYPAHRITKTVATGANSSLVVDHLCRNRSCVRISHLEFVTVAENVRRGTAGWNLSLIPKKTHCKYGHSLENAYLRKYRGIATHRTCRPCHARRTREYNRRKSEKV